MFHLNKQDNNNIYRELILEHWKDPQNYGVLENADIDVTDMNPLCGDEIHLTLKIENKKISDIAFESKGCAISKASASLFTEEIRNKAVDEITNMSEKEVLDLVEVELTPARKKCALLIHKTFLAGINNRATSK